MVFKIHYSYKSLFIFNNNVVQTYMLLYVDDLVLTGNNFEFLQTFVNALSSKFSFRNLGQLIYFLGIELVPHSELVILSEQKYIRDILERSNMSVAKEATTPLTTSTSLYLNDGSASVDGDEFRKIIGPLQYLTITRPDISFVVNKLSQYMHKPITQHFIALKLVF